MNSRIADFTEFETSQVAKFLTRRYHRPVDMQLADSELPLDPESYNTRQMVIPVLSRYAR